MEIEEKKLDLLKDAIRDTQSIIAMLDLKARFLLAVNLAIIAGLLVVSKLFLNYSSNLKINTLLLGVLLTAIGGIVLYNIFIIYKLIYDVINPRNNPFQQIINVDNKYSKSPFFPIPQDNCFDFEDFKRQIDNYSEEDLKNIYIVELLKVSFIRYQKLTNLNKIIFTHFKNLLIVLGLILITLFGVVIYLHPR